VEETAAFEADAEEVEEEQRPVTIAASPLDT
jgi:hypothetical protein